MISFHRDGRRFHFRAGAIALHHEHVLLHRLEGDEFWAVPGGRVEMGEQASNAIEREFHEELGLSVHCGPLLCVGENFFEYQGEPHHEVGLYFAIQLPPDSSIQRLDVVHVGVEGHRRLEFKWFAQRELETIDFRPLALRAMLGLGASIQPHFIQHASNAA